MFYTVTDLTKMFRVTKQTIYNWVRAGKLDAVRTAEKPGSKILFKKKDIDRMISKL